MERKTAKRITVGILAVGLTTALVIYLFPPDAASNPLGYDPLTNKRYLRDLRVYGGRANVMTAQFLQWFSSLWQGQTLAYTIAVLTGVTAAVFWFFATLPPAADETPPRG
ncbi:MAG TPA: hypothetical protein VHE61_19850 [Opitutaceae bacterium]|nr:hypothetical protein [Opitutaceae bacterium]